MQGPPTHQARMHARTQGPAPPTTHPPGTHARMHARRGLDNRMYYMLAPGGEYYNYSGCGNTLNSNHPVVRQFIVDCLKFWVTEYHIDGFRCWCMIPYCMLCLALFGSGSEPCAPRKRAQPGNFGRDLDPGSP